MNKFTKYIKLKRLRYVFSFVNVFLFPIIYKRSYIVYNRFKTLNTCKNIINMNKFTKYIKFK